MARFFHWWFHDDRYGGLTFRGMATITFPTLAVVAFLLVHFVGHLLMEQDREWHRWCGQHDGHVVTLYRSSVCVTQDGRIIDG